MTTWAQKIAALRELGMTLSEIGAAIDLSVGAVGDISQGRSKGPRADAALKLDALHREKCGESGVEAA